MTDHRLCGTGEVFGGQRLACQLPAGHPGLCAFGQSEPSPVQRAAIDAMRDELLDVLRRARQLVTGDPPRDALVEIRTYIGGSAVLVTLSSEGERSVRVTTGPAAGRRLDIPDEVLAGGAGARRTAA